MTAKFKANALTAMGWLGALCCGALVISTTGQIAFAALVGFAFLAWQPTVVLILVLVMAQEVKPGASFSGMTTLGSDIYFALVAKFPLTVILLGLAAFVSLARKGQEQKEQRAFSPTIVVAALLVFGTAVSGLVFQMDVASALGQVARPFLIFALGWIVGASYGANPPVMRSASLAGAAAMIALAVTGLPAALVSGTASGEHLVYYDTATAAIAAACFLAVLRVKQLSRGHLAVAISTAVVLLVSFRRSVIISLVLTLVVALLVNKQYRGMAKRVAVWAVALVLVGMSTVPSLLSTFANRLAMSYATIQGAGEDVSTEGHLDDITVGLQHALAQPLGYGPQTPQLTGLFVQGGTIYVHNELLLDWLRFGLIGLLVVLALLISMLVDSFKVLRRDPGTVPVAVSAASFLMPIFVVASISAPFLTTTNRWPALLGLGAGILAAYNSTEAKGTLSREEKAGRTFKFAGTSRPVAFGNNQYRDANRKFNIKGE